MNSFLRWTLIVGLFATLFLPFVVTPGLYFPFITGKGFAFRIIVEILLFVWLILALRDRSYLPKITPLFISLSSFVVIVFFANLFGVNRIASFWSNMERMEGFVLIAHLYAYFVVLSSVIKTSRMWHYFLGGSVIAGTGMALVGFSQLAGFYEIHQGGVRLDGTLGNAAYLAVYMLFNLFFAFYLFAKYNHRVIRGLLVVSMIMQLIALYHTATRGAILGLIGGALLTAIIVSIFSKRPVVKKISIGVLVAVVAFVGIFFLVKNTDAVQNSPVLSRFASISLNDNTTLSRFTIWGMAWEGVKERPLLGYGQSNFNIIFDREYDPVLENQEQWFDRAHNIIFDWLVASGFLGLIAYLSIFISSIYLLAKRIKTTVFERSLIVGLLAGYFFQNLFVFDQLISYIMFFVVISYIQSRSVDNMEINTGPVINSKTYKNAASALLVIVMLVTIYFVNIPLINANNKLIGAIQMQANSNGELFIGESSLEDHITLFKEAIDRHPAIRPEVRTRFINNAVMVSRTSNVPDNLKTVFALEAINEMVEQVEAYPNDSRYHYILGTSLVDLGQYQPALTYLERAIELSPRKQSIRTGIPYVYLGLGNLQLAIDSAKETYEINKKSDQAWNVYVDVATRAGLSDLGDQLINESVEIGETERVIRFFETMIARNPTNPQFRISLAVAYQRAGDVETSIQILEQTKVEFPETATAVDQFIANLRQNTNN